MAIEPATSHRRQARGENDKQTHIVAGYVPRKTRDGGGEMRDGEQGTGMGMGGEDGYGDGGRGRRQGQVVVREVGGAI